MMQAESTVVAEEGYPLISEVRKNLRVSWYRCPIDSARLRELSKRCDRKGWMQAGGHFSLFVLFATLSICFWFYSVWWAFAVSLWCLGFVASFFMGTSVHELGHGTVFKTRRLNRAFLYLFSLISWWDPFDYASSHTHHHRYTTHPNADRENLLPVQPSLHPWLLLQLFSISLFSRPGRIFGKGGYFWAVYLTLRSALAIPSGHTHIPSQEWLQVLHADQPESFRQSVIWSRILLLFHGAVWLSALLTGWWVLPLVLSMPSFIARIGSYLMGTTQHCGLVQNAVDFRKNTRSIRLNPLLAFFYWHMNWHTEHHMYANVPCYNLKYLASEIADDMPQPRSLFAAWREMRMIWHRQQSDPEFEYDRPVPNNVAIAATEVDQQLVGSIGELAPGGLQETN